PNSEKVPNTHAHSAAFYQVNPSRQAELTANPTAINAEGHGEGMTRPMVTPTTANSATRSTDPNGAAPSTVSTLADSASIPPATGRARTASTAGVAAAEASPASGGFWMRKP